MENPQSTTLKANLLPIFWLSVGFAALKLAIQIVGNILAQHAGYGIFRDELYYLVCGRRLAFGYVDQPPLVAVQARVSEMLFGYHTMWTLRLISGTAGAMKVFLTGMLCWALGGERKAAALAMLGDFPEAIRAFENALKADPANQTARDNLERARAKSR